MDGTPLRVVLVEDSPVDAKLLLRELRQAGYSPDFVRVESEAEYVPLLGPGLDVILCDYNLPQFDAFRALELRAERAPGVPFVIVSGSIGEETAVEVMKRGADDYLMKDRLGRLGAAVRQAIAGRHSREREARHREQLAHRAMLLASVRDSVVVTDLDGVVTYWNEGATRLFGWTAAETVGRPYADRFPEAVRAGVAAEVRAQAEGNDWGGEVEDYRKDGSRVWIDTRVSRFADADGRPAGVMRVAHDISARKEAEESLRFKHALLACQTEASPDGVLVVAPDGRILSHNHRFFELWKIPPELAATGTDARVLAAAMTRAADPAAFAARVAVIYANPDVRSHDEVPLADGRTLERHSGPIRGAAGELFGRVWFFRDITDRKQAAAELARVLARLRLKIERMPLAYVLCDADLRITDWNAAAERIFGYRKDEVLGMEPPFEKIIPAGQQPKINDVLRRLRAGDMTAHSVNENRTKDGRTITCEWSNTPLLDADGTFTGLLSLAQDVTERLRLEERVRQAQKMQAVGQLAGGVAHDFNNLLTVINGFSEVLMGELHPTDPRRERVAAILQAGERAAGLTGQLLAFSRKAIVAPQVLDLNDVVEQLGTLLRRLIEEHVYFTTALAPGLNRVRADRGQIEQVVMNLAVNARDAMPSGGQLTIETANVEVQSADAALYPDCPPGRYVRLTVADTGTGMTDAVKASLFEPFFTTKGVGKGTGLGLATVYGIVKQAGGQIAVTTAVGRGTTFAVLLPAVEDVVSGAATAAAAPDRGAETVLLVEDERAVRGLSRIALESQGYTVLEADTGDAALVAAERHPAPIHLLVTDVVMPGMGGGELADALRTRRPDMRVLYVSGYTDDAVVRHGVSEQTGEFLQKPFTPLGLARKVRAILDRAPVS